MIQRIVAKIPAIFSVRSERADKDRDPQQGNSQQQRQEERPTQEQAEQAFAKMLGEESFKQSGLSLELLNEEGLPVILVKNPSGKILKTMRGSEILRMLQNAATSTRILDRRV